jgi:hypothetical protein
MSLVPEEFFNPFYNRLTDLAACLCVQVEDSGLPGLCFCGVIPGDAAVGDHAGDCADVCGMGWVRLAAAYPAASVGVPDETPGNCSSSMGLDVELGILRCIEIPADGTPPSSTALAEATELQQADMLVMWRAVMCCDSISVKDAKMSGFRPMGPLGGLYGGAFTIQTVI